MKTVVPFPSRFEILIDRMQKRWKSDPAKRAVADGYRALRAHPHLLADLAQRNYVMTSPPDGMSDFDAGRATGRADCVREILRLANTDLATLLQVQR